MCVKLCVRLSLLPLVSQLVSAFQVPSVGTWSMGSFSPGRTVCHGLLCLDTMHRRPDVVHRCLEDKTGTVPISKARSENSAIILHNGVL